MQLQKLNNMAGSWISFSPTFKSHTVPKSCYSPTLADPLCADRATTTGGGVPSPPVAPWLMLKSSYDGPDDELVFRFYCSAKEQKYFFYPNEYNANPRPQLDLHLLELVGSSHGWLAFFDRKRSLLLTDPTTDQHVKLPPLDNIHMREQVHTLILAEEQGNAFLIYGPGRSLASCSPGRSRSRGWTLFGGGEYESVVYSSTHRRLLCLTSRFKLEAWDVEGESPTPGLDWVAHFESPAHHGPEWKTLKYIVCAEHSGELFVVVRHFNPEGWSRLERGIDSEVIRGVVDFEAYKVDDGKLVRMEGSLEVKPNSIYFGYDKRAYDDRPWGCRFGIFDYQKGSLNRSWSSGRINYDVDKPVWFTPRRLHCI